MNVARWKRRFSGTFRVFVYLALVNAFAAGFFLRRAQAQAEKAVEKAGAELARQLGPHFVGPAQAVTVNGQRLFFASTFTQQSPREVVDLLEQHCRDHSGRTLRELGLLPEQVNGQAVPSGLRDPTRWATSRADSDDGAAGQIACLAQPDDPNGFAGLLDRMAEFAISGDVSKLGDMRYFVVREHAPTGETQVLAMWTEGAFDIPAMFPESGDAPGDDSPDVPRPNGATRAFSASTPNRPYSLRIYESKGSASHVLSSYDADLPARGWERRPVNLDAAGVPTETDERARAFTKDGRLLLIAVDDWDDGVSGVVFVEMGTLGAAQAWAE
jgi:hypothetical protein